MYTLLVVTPRHSIKDNDKVVNVVEKAPIAKAVFEYLSPMMFKMSDLSILGFQVAPSMSQELEPDDSCHFATK